MPKQRTLTRVAQERERLLSSEKIRLSSVDDGFQNIKLERQIQEDEEEMLIDTKEFPKSE